MVEEEKTRSSSLSWLSTVRYEHLVAGMSGGIVSTLVLHPLDLLKIRLAVNTNSTTIKTSLVGGLRKTFNNVVRNEGVRGLYAGMSPNLVGAGSAWGFYFFFYNIAKSNLQNVNEKKQLSAGYHLLAASTAGVLTLTMTNPVWVVKTRLCLQAAETNCPKYSGLVDALVKIGKTEGLRGLYKGFVPGLFGVSHGAIQFMTYEEMKKYYNNYYNQSMSSKLGTKEYLTFAASSKLIAAFTTYPYQVVRTRLQDRQLVYKGSIDCIRRTYNLEGFSGFYKGLAPNLIRVVPTTMITFLVYENLSHFLLNRRTSETSTDDTKVAGIQDIAKKSS